jgi:hypothetical protein
LHDPKIGAQRKNREEASRRERQPQAFPEPEEKHGQCADMESGDD